jgi:predicted nucleic acid-binding protein
VAAFILDCSVTVSWFLSDEESSKYSVLLTEVATKGAIVPSLWSYEVANALLMAGRRNRISPQQIEKVLALLKDLPIKIDYESNHHIWQESLSLAEEHKLTAYDAAYLELAIRHKLPIATFDKALKQAAKNIGCILELCE